MNAGGVESPSEAEISSQVFALTKSYLSEFQHPKTGVLYGARLSGKERWTSPADVLAEKPHPWGYGSRIADTVLHTGHFLVALLDAHEARPEPFLRQEIRKAFEALRFIGSLPETHPKPGKPALEGLVPRGPHPDHPAAYFDDSSMDQHTTYIISLAVYANSELATDEEKKWIRESLGKVGRRLERNDWSIKRADGVTQAHVGFSWKGFNSSHASILLPSVLALYVGTGDKHWLEQYEYFLTESDERRWREVHPGPQIRINGHPIYANQNAFRVHAWYRFEKDPKRREIIRALLRQSTQLQLSRDFPGEFYRKFHRNEVWAQLRSDYDWPAEELQGASAAWSSFRPAMLKGENQGLAALAHIRFPLGGFHMALLSENPELIRKHSEDVWEMIQSVDLEKISAGETHYLFTVVGLHLYAHHFRNRERLTSVDTEPQVPSFGSDVPIQFNAGTGPVIDIAVEGEYAYAIGRSKLHILDIQEPAKPNIVGSLDDLGSVRQIVVRDAVTYITSRQDGLFIVDVSTPANPKLLNHYDTVEFATGVALSGDILFVACRHYGVELIDISDPENPSHISLVRTGEAQSVVSRNGFLYAGVWASSEVVVVDIRDPWRPQITQRVPLDGYGDGVDVVGDYLFVTTGHHSRETPRRKPGDPGFGKGHGLEILNISNPAHPTFVSRVKFPELYEIGNDMWGVTVANGHAFVADTYNGAFIVNVEQPSEPKIIGRTQMPFIEKRDTVGFVGGLALVDDYIYLAGGYSDFHVVEAKNVATRPVEEPDIPPTLTEPPGDTDLTPNWRVYRPKGQVHGVSLLSDARAVVACGSDGVHIIRTHPKIERLSVLEAEGFATDVSAVGNRVYIAEGRGGLSVCELNANELVRLGRLRIPGFAIRQVEAPDSGNRILVQAGANRFVVVDVSDPASPQMVFEDKRHGLLYGDQMMRGLVEDRYTCVFWHVSGLHWYDLKAQPRPTFSGDNLPERIGSSNGLIASNDKTLAMVRGGFALLDRSAPYSSDQVRRIGDRNVHLGVPTIADDRLYAAHRASGLITIADINDPQSPELVTQFETTGNPCRIAIHEGTMVIPNGNQGLLLIDPDP